MGLINGFQNPVCVYVSLDFGDKDSGIHKRGKKNQTTYRCLYTILKEIVQWYSYKIQ